ncbi:MAG: toprim domain-containing protein [Nanoarchaeota archaeon]
MEGYTDVILAHQGGLEHVVGTGGTAMTPAQARLLSKITRKPVLCYDGDAAGRKGNLEHAVTLLSYETYPQIVRIPGAPLVSLDPADVLAEFGAVQFLHMAVANMQDAFSFKFEDLLNEDDLDLAVPDTKHRIINEMLPFLAAPPDPILRAVYVETLAKKIDTSPKIVQYALTHYRERSSSHFSYTHHPTVPVEHELLHMLFHWPDLRSTVRLTADHFSTPELQTVYSYLCDTPILPDDIARIFINGNNWKDLFYSETTTSVQDILLAYAKDHQLSLHIPQLSRDLADIIFLSLPSTHLDRVDMLTHQIRQHHYDSQIVSVQEQILAGIDPVNNLQRLLALRKEASSYVSVPTA